MEKLSYYTTCQDCEEVGKTTPLEGVGDFDRSGNILALEPCPECGAVFEYDDWLPECDDCGELHYDDVFCGGNN